MCIRDRVKDKIRNSRGILNKPFLEYFKSKFKFDKIPIRLAFIMEDVYVNSKTSQMHIKSAARSTRTTVERAFAVLRKQGWIKLETSRRKEKYILTEKGKAFIEKIVSSL
jgi:predicted transcriptional regulator